MKRKAAGSERIGQDHKPQKSVHSPAKSKMPKESQAMDLQFSVGLPIELKNPKKDRFYRPPPHPGPGRTKVTEATVAKYLNQPVSQLENNRRRQRGLPWEQTYYGVRYDEWTMQCFKKEMDRKNKPKGKLDASLFDNL